MNHEQVIDLFTRYHDEDLSEEEQEAFEAHLDSCADCRDQWKSYQLTIGEISGLLQLSVPDDFSATVAHKIKKRSGGRFFNDRQGYSFNFAIVSFILILLFMLAYLVLTSESELTIIETDAGVELKQPPPREGVQLGEPPGKKMGDS